MEKEADSETVSENRDLRVTWEGKPDSSLRLLAPSVELWGWQGRCLLQSELTSASQNNSNAGLFRENIWSGPKHPFLFPNNVYTWHGTPHLSLTSSLTLHPSLTALSLHVPFLHWFRAPCSLLRCICHELPPVGAQGFGAIPANLLL